MDNFRFLEEKYWEKILARELRIRREFLNNLKNIPRERFYERGLNFSWEEKTRWEQTEGNNKELKSPELQILKKLEGFPPYNETKDMNQLGIKDYVKGLDFEKVTVHTRYNHSIGTCIIGNIYFEVLSDFLKYTIFSTLEKNKEFYRKILTISLYLHDVGHLPFCHLMEEVYEELNFTLLGDKTFRHDEAPLQNFNGEEREKLIGLLRNIIERNKEESEKWLEFINDLIAGISGIPFLDAIANSVLDADKIDYIFRDMETMETPARIRKPKRWLEDFFSNISLSPEGLVRINGEASLCMIELLLERQYLYKNLYLKSENRIFEKISSIILNSWLTEEISKTLLNLEQINYTQNNFNTLINIELKPDFRQKKGKEAFKIIRKKFNNIVERFKGGKGKPELKMLVEICKELSKSKFKDKNAKEWFEDIGKKMEKLMLSENEDNFYGEVQKLLVEEPFYIRKRDTSKVREIARTFYIDYPLTVLFDICEYPSFLATPKSRRFKFMGRDIYNDVFLVPDENPSKWARSKLGRVPLHSCKFSPWEKEFAQVIVINTRPDEVNPGYILDMFLKRCSEMEIEIFPFWEG